MPKFIYKHRRGTAEQWDSVGEDLIPYEGEIVLELDKEHTLHKLKIGDGTTPYKDLKYLMAGDEIVTQVLAQAKPRVVTVNLTTDWVKEDEHKYSQNIEIEGLTDYSRLDLQPSADMLAEFKQLNIFFVTENKKEHGQNVITIYSIGDKPLKSYEMQATIVETDPKLDYDKIIGITVGTPLDVTGGGTSDVTEDIELINNKITSLDLYNNSNISSSYESIFIFDAATQMITGFSDDSSYLSYPLVFPEKYNGIAVKGIDATLFGAYGDIYIPKTYDVSKLRFEVYETQNYNIYCTLEQAKTIYSRSIGCYTGLVDFENTANWLKDHLIIDGTPFKELISKHSDKLESKLGNYCFVNEDTELVKYKFSGSILAFNEDSIYLPDIDFPGAVLNRASYDNVLYKILFSVEFTYEDVTYRLEAMTNSYQVGRTLYNYTIYNTNENKYVEDLSIFYYATINCDYELTIKGSAKKGDVIYFDGFCWRLIQRNDNNFIINLTLDENQTLTADKTYIEIIEARDSNKNIFGVLYDTVNNLVTQTTYFIYDDANGFITSSGKVDSFYTTVIPAC